MSEKKSVFRRQRTWIDSPQQLRFCVELGVHALILPLFLLVMFAVEPFASHLVQGDSEVNRAVVVAFLKLLLANWWLLIAAVLVLGVISVLFSHRIFGPFIRFRQALKQSMQQDTRLKLNRRKGDYFADFAETLENYVNRGKVSSTSVRVAVDDSDKVH